MSEPTTVSIIVNNYNYARFLRDAVDSALAQSHPTTEVIVVDDGSTDDSRDVIAAYGSRVNAILKDNGGQASALNAGLAASKGSVIIFLDADDTLAPAAAARAGNALSEPDVVKVHWPLSVIDAGGARTGKTWPTAKLSDGDFRAELAARGPGCTASPPTSGNAWTREFLEQVMPIPSAYRLCADEYLFVLAPGFGIVRAIEEPLGCYRFHGDNQYQRLPMSERIRIGLELQERQCSVLADHLRRKGVPVDLDAWRRELWFPQLKLAVAELTAAVPAGASFILVDDDQWGMEPSFAGRRRVPFTERDGAYWGPPADDDAAVAELERLRAAGASHAVIARPAFWWLDHYRQFAAYLHARYSLSFRSDRMLVFDLTSPTGRR